MKIRKILAAMCSFSLIVCLPACGKKNKTSSKKTETFAATIEGISMEPTLYKDDTVTFEKFSGTPDCGDIILFDNNVSYTYAPGTAKILVGIGLEKKLVKRVIATGGQTLDIDFSTGTVTRDGKVLTEDYIQGDTINNLNAFEYPVDIPEGYVFVMGDNRERSADSRDPRIGFVKEDDILGRMIED